MIRIKVILLDAGGVILDESKREDFCAKTLTSLISIHKPDYGIDDYWNDVKIAVDQFYPSVYQGILNKNLGYDTLLYDQARREFYNRLSSSDSLLRLMSGFSDEIKVISKTHETAIAGQYGAELLDLLKRNNLLPYFTYHFTQDDFNITKPDPEYYRAITGRIGISPEACLMVGDRIDNDVIPAKTLGMKTILVRTGIHKTQKANDPKMSPDGELANIKGLASKIRELCNKS